MIYKILGIKIYDYSFDQVIDLVSDAVNKNHYHYIVTVNSEFINEATYNKDFRNALNNSWLSVPDAVGVTWAIKHLYGKIFERIPGVDLTWGLLKLAEERGYTVFLLGGWPEEVGQTAAKNIRVVHPNIKIIGTSATGPEDYETIEEINRLKPDLLFVAYGSPKQEIFLYNNRKKLNVKVAIGVGGTLDFISGKIKRAPVWMRRVGLEWFYRLIHQPSRIGRIFNATIVFPIKVIFSSKKKIQ